MSDSKNFILAIVLSVGILLAWQLWVEGPRHERAKKITMEQQKNEASVKSIEDIYETAKNPQVAAEKDTPIAREAILKGGEKRVHINNGKLHGSVALQGARFDDLTLAEFKTSVKKDADEVVLLSPSQAKDAYFAEFGWVSDGNKVAVPNKDTLWQADKGLLSTTAPLALHWDNGQGQLFTQEITLDDHYMFTIKQSVKNTGSVPVTLYPYGILHRVKDLSQQSFAILHEGPLGVLDDVLQEIRYKDLEEEKSKTFKSSKGWVGITDKYWLTALIPDQQNSIDVNFNYQYRAAQHHFQTDYLAPEFTLAPGEIHTSTQHLFTGAKKVDVLDGYGKKLGIPLFDRAVDFGWLYFITKPIFHALNVFYQWIGNFGLAILMLTISIKIVLFPLANKSYVSMHQLKRLQPQIQKLKERYKDDKMGFNKEVMHLYKREKVNPMAGCLPILIQIPIFFALYKVLFVTIEMRHAPFYGWIKDLSAMDPTNLFNLFGLIPWDPPLFLHVGIWPLVMGVTMWVQQKFNPVPNDPVQAKVMKMLPFLFVFMFATFPAGLVIYWAWNNTLSIIQQWIITRRLPAHT